MEKLFLSLQLDGDMKQFAGYYLFICRIKVTRYKIRWEKAGKSYYDRIIFASLFLHLVDVKSIKLYPIKISLVEFDLTMGRVST